MNAKVIVLTKFFRSNVGGADLETFLLVKNVLSKHFNTIVVSGTKRLEPNVPKSVSYIYWSVLETKYKPIEWLKLIAELNTLRSLLEKADIIYIPSQDLMPLAILMKAIKPSIRIILHLHNYQLLTFSSIVLAGRQPDVATDVLVEYGEHRNLLRGILAGYGHYLNYIYRLIPLYADKIICVSRKQCSILQRYLPSLRDKTVIIYNLPPPLPNINKKINQEPVLIYAGGGSYIKGYHLFLQILPRVLSKTKCRVYGTFGQEVSRREWAFLERLSRNFHGKFIPLNRMPREKYLKLHETAWGLLFPSICEEPLPYTIVESMLIGTIPIAANVGGVSEIVKGTPAEGYLFKPWNIDGIVERVSVLSSQSREDVIHAGIKLREYISKLFNREKIEQEIIKLFEYTISK